MTRGLRGRLFRLDFAAVAFVGDYFVEGFAFFRGGPVAFGVSDWEEGEDSDIGGDAEYGADFLFVEPADPAGAKAEFFCGEDYVFGGYGDVDFEEIFVEDLADGFMLEEVGFSATGDDDGRVAHPFASGGAEGGGV